MLSFNKSSSTEQPSQKPEPHQAPATATVVVEQATISRSLVIKGEISGVESLYIEGRVEGAIHFPGHRVTIGRHGSIDGDIEAYDVVIMGAVQRDIVCAGHAEIRRDGSLAGDVTTQRICVEEGAMVRGSIDVQPTEDRREKLPAPSQPQPQTPPSEPSPAAATEQPKSPSSVKAVTKSRVVYQELP